MNPVAMPACSPGAPSAAQKMDVCLGANSSLNNYILVL